MPRDVVLGGVRISFGRDDANSPARQEAVIRRWAGQNGFHRLELFRDIEGHRSGRREEGRPEWLRLKRRIHDPDVAVVVVEMLERAYRNLKLQLAFIDECLALGVGFVSVMEGFAFWPDRPSSKDDPFAPMREVSQRYGVQQFGAAAEMLSNLTPAKMRMLVEKKREDGAHWGTVSFGTQRGAGGKLEPAQDGVWYHAGRSAWQVEAPEPPDGWEWRGYHEALVRLCELYATDTFGYASLTEALNSEGWRFRDRWGHPQPFIVDNVRRVLYNFRTYAGHLTTGVSHPTKTTIVARDCWPPLVPLPVLEAVERILVTRGAGDRSNKRETNHYELSALLHCTRCGKVLEGQFAKGSRVYRHRYKGDCTGVGRARADELEAQTLDFASLFRFSEALRTALDAAARDEYRRLHPQQPDDAARLALLERRRRRYVDLYLMEHIKEVEYLTETAKLDEEMKALRERVSQSAGLAARFEEVLRRLEVLGERLERAEPQTRRVLYADLFERIEVDLRTCEMTYYPKAWAQPFF